MSYPGAKKAKYPEMKVKPFAEAINQSMENSCIKHVSPFGTLWLAFLWVIDLRPSIRFGIKISTINSEYFPINGRIINVIKFQVSVTYTKKTQQVCTCFLIKLGRHHHTHTTAADHPSYLINMMTTDTDISVSLAVFLRL